METFSALLSNSQHRRSSSSHPIHIADFQEDRNSPSSRKCSATWYVFSVFPVLDGFVDEKRTEGNRSMSVPWRSHCKYCWGHVWARPLSLWWCHRVKLDFCEYYLPLFEWLIIAFTFQIGTKFQLLVCQKHTWVMGESIKGEVFLFPLILRCCAHWQIILFAQSNPFKHLLMDKEFQREKIGIERHLFHEIFPAYLSW